MRVVSVNVGLPRDLVWEGRVVRTAFRKQPVDGRIAFSGTSLAGDVQADRTGHGGPRKSVYAYPSEHYPRWSAELGLPSLPWGSFGENLTTEGWTETEARVGDRVRIGTAEFEVVQPRRPCVKMEAAFQRGDMMRRFQASGRSGFYLAGRADGALAAGDRVELLRREPGGRTIHEVNGPGSSER